MCPINPNDLFFANYLDSSSKINDLEQFSNHMNWYLINEAKYFDEEAHPDITREFLPLFSQTFPPILHSSLIISTVILLEQEMRGYTAALLEALGSHLRLNDLAGSVLERFRTVSTKIVQLNFNQKTLGLEDVNAIFEIRNCLVHANGVLTTFQKASIIRDFSKRHETPDINSDILKITSSTSDLVVHIASSFLYEIYNSALEHFPGKNQPPRRWQTQSP